MRETNLNTEVTNSLKNCGAWAYKIADQPTSWTASRTRFTPEKPCDIVGMYKGHGFLIESKMIKKWEAFGLNRFRPSQIENLDEYERLGGKSFCFLNVRISKPYENRLLIWRWPTFKKQTEEKSIGYKDLQNVPFIKGFKKEFDLKRFLREAVLDRRSE